MPHTDVRDYYVTMRRGEAKPRTAWLAGPLPSHTMALELVGPASALARQIDIWADFDSFGTASMPRAADNPVGRLNIQFGISA